MGSFAVLFGLLFLAQFQKCSATAFGSVIRINVEVCPDGSSGTGDTIFMELLGNSKSTSCSTKRNGGSWNAGGKEIIKGEHLGNCTRFYPSFDGQNISDRIEARVRIDDVFLSRNMSAFGYDAVQLCSVVVEFGVGEETWYAYEWIGRQWWKENEGQIIQLSRRSALFLEKITAKVCPDTYSGTDDTIRMELHDGYNSCITKAFNELGKNIVLSGQAVEDCRILNTKNEHLSVRASIDNTFLSGGFTIGSDAIQLCSIQVDFKDHKSYEGVSYVWKGKQWWEENAGPFVSLSKVGKSIDEIVAPISYNAQIVAWPWNNWLSSSSKTFDKLAPTLVINGIDTEAPPRIVEWNELKNNQQDGSFNLFVRQQLAGIFSSAQQLVIVTHGWRDGDIQHCDKSWVTDFAQKIGRYENIIEEGRLPTATIALCWNSQPLPDLPFLSNMETMEEGKICELSYIIYGLRWIYYANAASTGKVGELLGKLITAIKAEYPNIRYVHGIGHSLGAHVMGNIYNFGGLSIDRISGLDPAGPCFENSIRDIHIADGRKWGLTKYSANFVDNIHTDGGYYGTYLSKGLIDILAGDPNIDQSGAGVQPTCSTCTLGCCHKLAPEYYLYSIRGNEMPKFHTSYMTQSQDESSYQARNIGPANPKQRIYAGYHTAQALITTSGFKGRMFLPIFNVDGHWYPICDKANIPIDQQHWCNNV